MTSRKKNNKFVYLLLCAFSGITTALIVWIFLRLMNLGIELFWSIIPEKIGFNYYPIVMCTIGGLIIGLYQKKTKVAPEDLQTVIGKVRKEKFYPYDKVFLLCIAAFLPLIFGGSIGPEAGLTGVIVGLCYWARDNMKFARDNINDLAEITINSAFTAIFIMPLFGTSAVAGINKDSSIKVQTDSCFTEAETEKAAPHKKNMCHLKSTASKERIVKIVSNLIAIFCSFGTLILLNDLFGGASGIPKITEFNITVTERIWGIPLAIIGVLAAYLFIAFEDLAKHSFGKLKEKQGIVPAAVIGGLLLGLLGTIFPFVMFSGEEGIIKLQETCLEYSPWLLITVGIIKLLLTNICISSGWKGGHFFPVIFSAISIGFGVSMLVGLDAEFCAATVTAGLLGTIMKQPLVLCVLLVMLFDLRMLFWIVIAILVGTLGGRLVDKRCHKLSQK